MKLKLINSIKNEKIFDKVYIGQSGILRVGEKLIKKYNLDLVQKWKIAIDEDEVILNSIFLIKNENGKCFKDLAKNNRYTLDIKNEVDQITALSLPSSLQIESFTFDSLEGFKLSIIQNSNNKKAIPSNILNEKDSFMNNVMYVKAYRNQSLLFYTNGSTKTYWKNIKHIETKFANLLSFKRVHHSYIINTEYIQKYNKNTNKVLMVDNKEIPVSNTYLKKNNIDFKK